MPRVYTPLVGWQQGADRLHLHVTDFCAETEAERSSHYTHRHAAEEAFYILEGEATFRLPEGARRVRPGDTVFFPAGATHGEFEVHTERLRYLVIRTVEDEDPPCCCGGDKPSGDSPQ